MITKRIKYVFKLSAQHYCSCTDKLMSKEVKTGISLYTRQPQFIDIYLCICTRTEERVKWKSFVHCWSERCWYIYQCSKESPPGGRILADTIPNYNGCSAFDIHQRRTAFCHALSVQRRYDAYWNSSSVDGMVIPSTSVEGISKTYVANDLRACQAQVWWRMWLFRQPSLFMALEDMTEMSR